MCIYIYISPIDLDITGLTNYGPASQLRETTGMPPKQVHQVHQVTDGSVASLLIQEHLAGYASWMLV